MNGKDGWMDGQYGLMDRMDGMGRRTEWNGMGRQMEAFSPSE